MEKVYRKQTQRRTKERAIDQKAITARILKAAEYMKNNGALCADDICEKFGIGKTSAMKARCLAGVSKKRDRESVSKNCKAYMPKELRAIKRALVS